MKEQIENLNNNETSKAESLVAKYQLFENMNPDRLSGNVSESELNNIKVLNQKKDTEKEFFVKNYQNGGHKVWMNGFSDNLQKERDELFQEYQPISKFEGNIVEQSEILLLSHYSKEEIEKFRSDSKKAFLDLLENVDDFSGKNLRIYTSSGYTHTLSDVSLYDNEKVKDFVLKKQNEFGNDFRFSNIENGGIGLMIKGVKHMYFSSENGQNIFDLTKIHLPDNTLSHFIQGGRYPKSKNVLDFPEGENPEYGYALLQEIKLDESNSKKVKEFVEKGYLRPMEEEE